jgi:hypothetical protein
MGLVSFGGSVIVDEKNAKSKIFYWEIFEQNQFEK